MNYQVFARSLNDRNKLVVLGNVGSAREALDLERDIVQVLSRLYPTPESCELGIRKFTGGGIAYSTCVGFDTTNGDRWIEFGDYRENVPA